MRNLDSLLLYIGIPCMDQNYNLKRWNQQRHEIKEKKNTFGKKENKEEDEEMRQVDEWVVQ